MKRSPVCLLFCMLCLSCLLAACGGEEPPEDTAWTEAQMAQAVWDSQGGAEARALLTGGADFAAYVSEYYELAPDAVLGGAVLYAGGVSAQEVAVLRLADADAAGKAEAALKSYIDGRAGAFAGYAPEQSAILEKSGAVSRGRYAALLICPDQQAARDAFDACFTSDPPEEESLPEPAVQASAAQRETPAPPPPAEEEEGPEAPPVRQPEDTPAVPGPEEAGAQPEPDPESTPDPEPEPEPTPEPEPEPEPQPEPEPEPEGPWSYDRERIVSSWRSGDREGLWEQDLEILAVLDGIPALTDDTLSGYERELALHDWMIGWAEYDPGALDHHPSGEPMPDNDNPYGFLTGKKGICLGYATTFQLLMDLCGIECVTVRGTSHAGTADHAWNMVRLEDDWYCVDVTWDDPVSSYDVPVQSALAHRYFNVTSEHMRQNDHQWEEGGVPEAEGTALAWAP